MGRKEVYGRTFDGVHRMSFLIGTDGKIEKTYAKVKPAEHALQVLADLGIEGEIAYSAAMAASTISQKRFGGEGCATNQAPIHAGLGKQTGRIFGFIDPP